MQRVVQQNLVTFLEIEIDIANTFVKMAKTAENHDRLTRLLESAQRAVANKNQRRKLLSLAAEVEQSIDVNRPHSVNPREKFNAARRGLRTRTDAQSMSALPPSTCTDQP